MNENTITFLMPGRSPIAPIGGYKVVYEYANRLIERGYKVRILYPLTRNFASKSLKDKLKYIPRFIKWKIEGVTGKKWFNLNENVEEKIVWSLNRRHVPDSDFYIATEVHTSYYLQEYPIDTNRKAYLIQDYEEWLSSKEYVDNSFRLGLKNIVISDWLKQKVEATGATATVIKNGFDFDYFKREKDIKDRNPFTISMLYHNDERKGCKYGIEAFKIIHEKYPLIKFVMFGVPDRPSFLPEWIDYYQKPDKETHNKIYNDSSIYLAPSIQEGWGLTVGEAMICGAAIVCTEAPGFKEMVKDGESGIICKLGDSQALVKAIETLINNENLRVKVASNGNLSIQKFTWENSVDNLISLL